MRENQIDWRKEYGYSNTALRRILDVHYRKLRYMHERGWIEGYLRELGVKNDGHYKKIH